MNESQNHPISNWWDEGREPTPKEFIDWFIGLDYGKKLEEAQKILNTYTDGFQCMLEDHIGRLNWCMENHRDKI